MTRPESAVADDAVSPSRQAVSGRYAGRHRAPRTPNSTMRGVGAGLALPVVAATALVVAQRADGADVTTLGANDAIPARATDVPVTSEDLVPTYFRPAPSPATGTDANLLQVSRDQTRQPLGGTNTTAEQAEAQKQAVLAQQAQAAQQAEQARIVKQTAAVEAKRWVRPIAEYDISSGYGMRHGRLHPALDLAGAMGTPVVAMSTGTVISSGWSNLGYGYMVQIQYWDGTVSWYAHNTKLVASVGDRVAPGEVVAYRGSTGRSTGPHVHLEIHPNGGPAVNPGPWLAARGIPM